MTPNAFQVLCLSSTDEKTSPREFSNNEFRRARGVCNECGDVQDGFAVGVRGESGRGVLFTYGV